MIFEISNAGSVTKKFIGNTWTPDADTWYHVAVTRKDGVFNFYLNGVSHGMLKFILVLCKQLRWAD